MLALLLLVVAPLVHAQDRAADLAPPTAPSGFALELDVGTTLPLVIGGTVALEVPGHVVFRMGAGIVPSSYVDAVNAIGVASGAYDAGDAGRASLLLNDATLLEVGLALRPMGTPGIELAVSYAMLWSHRRIDMQQLGGAGHDAGLDLTIDAVHAEVAWQTELAPHLHLRVALGWAHAFDHHVSVAGDGDAAQQAAFRASADALGDAIGRHAFGPTLGVALGVRL